MTLIQKINQKLASEHGMKFEKVARATEPTSFKTKVLAAADRQLKQLEKMNDADSLNYQSKGNSGKFWWSAKPKDGMRYVRYYVANRLLDPNVDQAAVPNSIAAVQTAIKNFRIQAADTSEADWAELERERKAQQKARPAKKH